MATLRRMKWRPLSKRGKPDAVLDEPTEGLPGYLQQPVIQWFASVFRRGGGYIDDAALQKLQLWFKLDPPLDWRSSGMALADLAERIVGDGAFALDVLDYMLHHTDEFTGPFADAPDVVQGLAAILTSGGSAWEVTWTSNAQAFQLSRRATGPIRQAIESIPPTTRAHQHLVDAWNRLSQRNPDASGAYREAVRAVEAVGKPIILPSNDRATLGTMIAALCDKPEKWEVTLGSVEEVRRMMELIWTNQLDRHGTDDESVPLNVSLDQADVAVHVALALVRIFAGGHIRAAGSASLVAGA